MAGFCTKCGRPLPENGVCPCSYEQPAAPVYTPPAAPDYAPPAPSGYVPPAAPGYAPPAPSGYVPPEYAPAVPSPFGLAMKNLPRLFGGYFKDPVRTTQLAAEKRDFLSGLIVIGITTILALFGMLFFGLVHFYDFGDYVPAWIVTGLFAPLLACGLTIGLLYALTAIARMRVDFRSVLAIVGVNCIIPAALLAGSMFLSMISPTIFGIFATLLLGAWFVTFFMCVFQVLGLKMNIISIMVLIGGLSLAYFMTLMMEYWFILGKAVIFIF